MLPSDETTLLHCGLHACVNHYLFLYTIGCYSDVCADSSRKHPESPAIIETSVLLPTYQPHLGRCPLSCLNKWICLQHVGPKKGHLFL